MFGGIPLGEIAAEQLPEHAASERRSSPYSWAVVPLPSSAERSKGANDLVTL